MASHANCILALIALTAVATVLGQSGPSVMPCPCSLPAGYEVTQNDLAGAIRATGNCPVDITTSCPSGNGNFGYNNNGGCGNVGCNNFGTGNVGNDNTGTGNHGDNNNGSNNIGRCLDGTSLTGDKCGSTTPSGPATPPPASPAPSGTAGISIWWPGDCNLNQGSTTRCGTSLDLSGDSYPDASCCSSTACYDSTSWDGTTPKDPFVSLSSEGDLTCSSSYTSACCPLAPQGP